MTAKPFSETSLDEAKELMQQMQMPSFRYNQICNWIFKKNVFSFDGMKNISKEHQEKLIDMWPSFLPEITAVNYAQDGTIKVAVRYHDQETIEAAALVDQDKITFCLSAQAGCSVGCIFCKTGQSGLKRNLTPMEIISQYLVLIKQAGRTPDNIVFMGMGEPFHNTSSLFEAIRILVSKEYAGMASRRITISTAGVPRGIIRLSQLPGEVNLAVSLHAADDDTRTKLVPLNSKYPLGMIKEAVIEYIMATSRRVSFEIVLLKGINDSDKDALNLVEYCKDLNCHINIIRYNKYKGTAFERSPEKNEKQFRKILKKANIAQTVRKSRGAEIQAACGQLAGKNNG